MVSHLRSPRLTFKKHLSFDDTILNKSEDLYVSLLINPKNILMKNFRLPVLALAGLLAFSCTTHHEAAETSTVNEKEVAAEITSLWATYLDAWESGDAETCLSYMTADFINMPGLDAATDFQATREMFNNLFENNIIEGAGYRPIEFFVHDSMTFEFGYLDQVWINRTTGDTSQFTIRGASVWKKMEDGSWKIHRWMAQD